MPASAHMPDSALHIYYAPPACFRAGRIVLPPEEARHAGKVMRQQVGDEVVVVDGEGGWHRVRLDAVDARHAAGTILETLEGVGEPAAPCTIGLALLKNRSRFEVFLEKAVELGVTALIPLHTARTERTRFNPERAQKLLIAAMKQCGRSCLPPLSTLQPLAAVLQNTPAAQARFIAHETTNPAETLPSKLKALPVETPITVLIGPEGGFTPEEMALAHQNGWTPVSLGPRRLRAETAGIVAATAVHLWRSGVSS